MKYTWHKRSSSLALSLSLILRHAPLALLVSRPFLSLSFCLDFCCLLRFALSVFLSRFLYHLFFLYFCIFYFVSFQFCVFYLSQRIICLVYSFDSSCALCVFGLLRFIFSGLFCRRRFLAVVGLDPWVYQCQRPWITISVPKCVCVCFSCLFRSNFED